MANRERGEQRLVAGAQTFTLRLTIDACLEVEDRSGKTLDDLIGSVNRGSVRALRWLLWASLQAKHAAEIPRPEDVGPVMDAIGSPADVRAIIAAFLVLNRDDRPVVKQAGQAKSDRKHDWGQLFIDARCLGLAAQEFWQLSLKELWHELAVAEQQTQRARDRDVTLAWMVGAFIGWRKMPQLASVLSKTSTAVPRQQTWQEMKAKMKAITKQQEAIYGGR